MYHKFKRIRELHSGLLVLIRIIIDIAQNDPMTLGGVIASLGNKLDKSEEHARKISELEEATEEMKEKLHNFEED